MKPIVSVIMAAKNYARFIPQAVESVQSQTFADWELLIIDDGSTDNTPATVKPYLSDSRIHYYRTDRLGQPRAKNLGFNFSQGQFITYLDADDAWQPTKLAKQLEIMRSRSDVGVCYTGRDFMNETGTVTPGPDAAKVGFCRGQVLDAIFLKNFVCFSSVMIRREVLEYVGAFSPNLDLAIDYDLWLRVARLYEFDYINENLVLYRTGHGNLSQKLTDRVDTAVNIMNQAYARPSSVSKDTYIEGSADTIRTLAYVMRPSEPLTAMKLYWRSMRVGGPKVLALRGMAASLLRWASCRRQPGVPDNATVNL